MSSRAHQPMLDIAMDPDPAIEAYKHDLDRTLLSANLQKSVEERIASLIALQEFVAELRRGARRAGLGPPHGAGDGE